MSNIQYIAAVSLIGLSVLFFVPKNFAQAEDNRNSKEKTSRSSATVNPTTLGLEFSVPLNEFPGRAGNSLPLVFNYSSKVWDIVEYRIYNGDGTISFHAYPIYADRSEAGWTNNLQSIYVEDTSQRYNVPLPNGGGGGGGGGGFCYIGGEACFCDGANHWCPPNTNSPMTVTPNPYHIIPKYTLHLPDGSVYHLFGNGNPNPIFVERNTTNPVFTEFYSLDGSNLRLSLTSPTSYTLYLPDGTRYFSEIDSNNVARMIKQDVHGNRTVFQTTPPANGAPAQMSITDTFGRQIQQTPGAPRSNAAPFERIAGDVQYQVPGFAGASRNYIFKWRNLNDAFARPNYVVKNLNQLFYFLPPLNFPPHNPVVLKEISMPNGESYQFRYNEHGEIEKIVHPTGSEEVFQHQMLPPFSYNQQLVSQFALGQGNRGVTNRKIYENSLTIPLEWQYNIPSNSNILIAEQPYRIESISPDGILTKRYIFAEPIMTNSPIPKSPSLLAGRVYREDVYDSGNPRKLRSRTLTKWAGAGPISPDQTPRPDVQANPRVERTTTIVYENEQSLAVSQTFEHDAYLNVTLQTSYDYVANANAVDIDAIPLGTPLRTTQTTYKTDTNYLNKQMVSMPFERVIKNGDRNGAMISKSQMVYDESLYLQADSGALTGNAAATWVNPNTTLRALATTQRVWNSDTGQWIDTHTQYDQYGNARKVFDPVGNVAETVYSTETACAYPTQVITPAPDPTGVHGSNTPFTTSTVYDFNTGLPTSTTDINGQTSTIEYNDALLRPTKVTAANGQQAITEYGDSPGNIFVKVSSQLDETNWKVGYKYFDALLRPTKTRSVDNAGDVYALTCYDNMSRVSKTSNPFRNFTNQTCTTTSLEWTSNTFDPLGRPISITTPDGAHVDTAYSIAATGNQIGTAVTVTDQALKQRRSITNALGQLVRVDEPNDNGQLGQIDAPAQDTRYAYDGLNNLKTVTQGIQTRTFVYDSLSRLKSATNPESGTINYGYDNNGNLTSKTDARSITTTYAYDALNRVKTRTYSDSTPAVSYFYDNITNAKGKLIKVSSSISTTEYTSFDILGRVTRSKQITDGVTYGDDANPMTYGYNLASALIEQKYPSGRVVKNTLDSDGELQQVQSRRSNDTFRNYANSFVYTAAGAITSMRLGNGKFETTQFNSRLQSTQIGLGASIGNQGLLKINYDYGVGDNNGNVQSQITNTGNTTFTQTYHYDSLNRLTEAKEVNVTNQQTWKQNFGYDRFGNRTTFSETILNPDGSTTTSSQTPQIDQSKNRFTTASGFVYDLSGNVITDNQGQTFNYDSENKQTKLLNSRGGVIGEYKYDGNGGRIKKIVGNDVTIFVYDAASKLVAEYSTETNNTPYINYTTADTLGSARIITNQNGNVVSRRDFKPFGEELSRQNYGNDSVRKNFTGYEKDDETNLNFAQARYYSSNFGRFATTDPELMSISPSRPQSLNRYVYTLNNPVLYVDPDGELWVKNDKIEYGRTQEYIWVDTCGKGQTCYEAIAVEGKYGITVYGSNDFRDITKYQVNNDGMINVRELSNHHNAEFIVANGQNVPEEYLSPKASMALFNVAKAFSEVAPGADKLVFTAGASSDGKPGTCGSEPCHSGHTGDDIDIRYVGSDGKSIQGDTAYKSADVNTTNWLIASFANYGLPTHYTGDNSRFGLPDKSPKYRDGTEKVHRHHLHVGISKPKGK